MQIGQDITVFEGEGYPGVSRSGASLPRTVLLEPRSFMARGLSSGRHAHIYVDIHRYTHIESVHLYIHAYVYIYIYQYDVYIYIYVYGDVCEQTYYMHPYVYIYVYMVSPSCLPFLVD